jgi:hypothetical protein
VTPYTRYFWKELTDEGKLIDAPWATPTGYEHQDEAIIHFHMKFTVDPYSGAYGTGPKWHLMKFYGLKTDK